MSLGASKVLGQPGHQQQQMTLGNPGSLTSANVLGQPRQLDILVDPALLRQSRHCMRLTHFDQLNISNFCSIQRTFLPTDGAFKDFDVQLAFVSVIFKSFCRILPSSNHHTRPHLGQDKKIVV